MYLGKRNLYALFGAPWWGRCVVQGMNMNKMLFAAVAAFFVFFGSFSFASAGEGPGWWVKTVAEPQGLSMLSVAPPEPVKPIGGVIFGLTEADFAKAVEKACDETLKQAPVACMIIGVNLAADLGLDFWEESFSCPIEAKAKSPTACVAAALRALEALEAETANAKTAGPGYWRLLRKHAELAAAYEDMLSRYDEEFSLYLPALGEGLEVIGRRLDTSDALAIDSPEYQACLKSQTCG